MEAADRPYPELAPAFSARGAFDVCRAAGHPAAPPAENRPVESDVPTLLLTGRLDPVTPSEWARLAARTLARSRVVLFPTLAHRAFSSSICARRIGLAFVEAPLRRPDTRCVARMPRLRWVS